MRHVESIATVLFRSKWRRGIIKDDVSVGLTWWCALLPPVVSGIGLAEGKRKGASALQQNRPERLLLSLFRTQQEKR